METFEASEPADNDNLITLLELSLGCVNAPPATAAFSIKSDEDLFSLMAQAHLPLPRLSNATTRIHDRRASRIVLAAIAAVPVALLPDAGSLVILTHEKVLDLLSAPGWSVQTVDFFMHEVTRNVTPDSTAIGSHHTPPCC